MGSRSEGGRAFKVPFVVWAAAMPEIGVAVWCVWAFAALASSSPFNVALDEAAGAGGGHRESVHMQQGTFGYRLVFSVASAQVLADTPNGRVEARIRLVHVPLYGWSVRSFERIERLG